MKIQIIHCAVEVKAPLNEVFYQLFAMDLLQVFTGLHYVPNLEYYFTQKPSNRPGFERIVYFQDLSNVRQKLLIFLPEMSFSIRIDTFSSVRYFGLEQIVYQFYFSNNAEGITTVRCEYQFDFKSRIINFFFEKFAKEVVQQRNNSFMESVRTNAEHHWEY